MFSFLFCVHVEALVLLPVYCGTCYRAVNLRFKESLYSVDTTITWQSFSSTTRKQLETLKFLKSSDSMKLIGTVFVLTVKTGRSIEDISAFPTEEEVLIMENSHWRVTDKATSLDQKKELCADLAAYDLSQLDVYSLKQL